MRSLALIEKVRHTVPTVMSYPALLSLASQVRPVLQRAEIDVDPVSGPVVIGYGVVSGYRQGFLGCSGVWPVTFAHDTRSVLGALGFGAFGDDVEIEITAEGGEIVVASEGREVGYVLLDMADVEIVPSDACNGFPCACAHQEAEAADDRESGG